jgi:transcriptional regulator with XRE-family HTH domain
MPTSQTTLLSKPEGESRLRRPTLAYVTKRARQQAYNFMVSEFKKGGISQSTLARRMGRGADQISRLLRGPSNVGVDTLATFLFAASGGLLTYGVTFPFGAPEGFVTEETKSNVIELHSDKSRPQSTPMPPGITVALSDTTTLEFMAA